MNRKGIFERAVERKPAKLWFSRKQASAEKNEPLPEGREAAFSDQKPAEKKEQLPEKREAVFSHYKPAERKERPPEKREVTVPPEKKIVEEKPKRPIWSVPEKTVEGEATISAEEEKSIREEMRKIREQSRVTVRKQAPRAEKSPPVEKHAVEKKPEPQRRKEEKKDDLVEMVLTPEEEKPAPKRRIRTASDETAGFLSSFDGKPKIGKKVEKDGSKLSVYLTITNPANAILKNVFVTDTLPKDAGDFRVLTSGLPYERIDNQVVWKMESVKQKDKRVIYYQITSKEKLPAAVLEWDA